MKVINNYGFTTRLVYCWEKPSPFPLVYDNCLSLICLYRLETNQFKKDLFINKLKTYYLCCASGVVPNFVPSNFILTPYPFK